MISLKLTTLRKSVYAMLLAAGTMSAAQAMTPTSIQLPTGPTGGGYYFLAGLVGNTIQSATGVTVTVMPSAGSGENLALMGRGDVEMTMGASNSVYPAWQGLAQWEGRPVRNYRAIMFMFPNPTVFTALESSGITSIQDLAGKRVGVGTAPVPWDTITGPFLEAHGLRYPGDIRAVYAPFGPAQQQIGDGLLDAAIATSTVVAIQELARSNRINYLTWDDDARAKLAEQYPYFIPVEVPGDQLPGFSGDVYKTVDMGGPYLLIRDNISDDFVYTITKAIHENLPRLAASDATLRFVNDNPEFLTQPLGDFDLFHPGAIRYWREVGLWRD